METHSFKLHTLLGSRILEGPERIRNKEPIRYEGEGELTDRKTDKSVNDFPYTDMMDRIGLVQVEIRDARVLPLHVVPPFLCQIVNHRSRDGHVSYNTCYEST